MKATYTLMLKDDEIDVDFEIDADVAGEGHFQSSDQQAAVGTVVVSQQHAVGILTLDHGEEGLEVFGVGYVRCLASELSVGLGKNRGTHAVLATAQLDQNQVGFALVQPQLRVRC